MDFDSIDKMAPLKLLLTNVRLSHPSFNRITLVDVVVSKDDQSSIGAHEKKSTNSQSVPPKCPAS
jgi:hypothetical protein